ncbi:hypothetical protein [Nodularia sphaerocarpa]|uniref:hypothetical protein n=1 Tax=Nodularia sphaerocarpa TaxID=137816 RepID=UPI001EFB151E|nr:hypothetical protein [Nodularia sphaerocarpa]MDB9375443.1 hypothetical protein [Nodularia sphaerocarpa CS-585]MDB9380051.1 hypothetical protein [Nodularia sphaerocarpa CS-585A2]ULP71996.1 hypothetical protein BDGGKGIB_01633 [Nodularia sphaerocarpa UHCC 0038]
MLEEVVFDADEIVLKRLVESYNLGKLEVMINGKTYSLSIIDKIRIFQIDDPEGFRRAKSNFFNKLFGEEYFTAIKFGRDITDELIIAPWYENRRKNIRDNFNKTKEPKIYVNIKRLEQLKSISNSRFDLSKLIQYCEEINKCFDNDCLLSVAMLVRAIIDHIPPIFNKSTFNEVANNYGSKSFQGSMKNLNNSLRKIADSYLHTHIRSKEVLPNEIQIDFSQDLDVLLGEICRILK